MTNITEICGVKCEPIRYQSGSKYDWATFKTKEEAEEVAKAVAVVREQKLARGHDFGYGWPGAIQKAHDGYSVCVL